VVRSAGSLTRVLLAALGTNPAEAVDLGAFPPSSELRAVTETPRFKELVVRWVQLRRTPPDLATSALTARLAMSVHGRAT